MNENQIMKICIVGLIICLSALYIFTYNVHSIHVNIGDIDNDWAGRTVNVSGKIRNLHEYKGHLFFDLSDGTGMIKIVIWENTLELLEMKKMDITKIKNGQGMDLVGYVELYKGKLEVIPIREQVKLHD